MTSLPDAAFVIPTRDRPDDLAALINSVRAQTVAADILVMDDGASDATARMLAHDFRGVRHHRLGSGRGPAFQRNRGIELANAKIIFAVVHSTVFVSPSTV